MKVSTSFKAARHRDQDSPPPRPSEATQSARPVLLPRQPVVTQKPPTELHPARIRKATTGQPRATQMHDTSRAEPPDVRQARAAYEAARTQGCHRAFDLHGNVPSHQAFIKERDQGGVDLWVFSNSNTRQSGDPCIEHLYWPDTDFFQDHLFLGSKHNHDCPKGFAGKPPAIEALLEYLGSVQLPVETLVGSLRKNLAPRSVAFSPSPGETAANKPTAEKAAPWVRATWGQGLPLEARRRMARQMADPVRLVDRVNARVDSVIACPALLNNIAAANEGWVVLDDGKTRARLELADMRICVDHGLGLDAMFIWLTPGRARVIDITGPAKAALLGLAKFVAHGLLHADFVSSAPPPEPLRVTPTPGTSCLAQTVTADDVEILHEFADLDAQLPCQPIPWDASEAGSMLPQSVAFK